MARVSAVNSPQIRLPKLCVHPGKNLAYCRVDGKFHYFGPAGQPESTAKYRQFLAEMLTGGVPIGRDVKRPITVCEMLDTYERAQERLVGIQSYAAIGVRQLRDLYGHERAQDIGPKKLKTLMRVMAASTSYCRSTVNKVSSAIKGIFGWAVSEELIEPAIWQSLTSVPGLRAGDAKREGRKVFPVDDTVFENTLEHLPRTLQAVLRLLKLTGARPSELLTLTPAMVDKSGDVWTATLRHHKTAHRGKVRVLNFGPRAQEILKPFLLRGANEPCFSAMEGYRQQKSEGKLNHRHQPNAEPKTERCIGDSYTKDSLGKAVARACDKAGVDRWVPYQLRHSAATAARQVAGLDGAQVMLGHSGMNITERYAEVNQDKAKQIARVIG